MTTTGKKLFLSLLTTVVCGVGFYLSIIDQSPVAGAFFFIGFLVFGALSLDIIFKTENKEHGDIL